MAGRFLERGGLWVVGQITLMVGVVVLGSVYQAKQSHWGLIILGGFFGVSAVFFGLAGALALKENLTPFPEPLPQARLVQRGIYGYIRHPLYTCVLCAAIGWALLCHSWPAFVLALVLVPFFEAKARVEERWLRERFTEYGDYARQTKRFIPWIY